MAFKNLLSPNVASGGDFLRTITGYVGYNATPVLDSSKSYKGTYSIQAQCSGTHPYEGLNLPISLLNTSNYYSAQLRCLSPLNTLMFIWMYNSETGTAQQKTWTATGEWDLILLPGTVLVSNPHIYMGSHAQKALNFNIDCAQIEVGTVCTSYEFPGLDLTGNSITSNEAVQNLKLNQELKMFGIASEEQVQNLTVENILQLLQVPSSEYVNNLEICNSIFMEAIESTETVNELIAWVACEFMKCNITMKTPKTILKMKYPR